MKRYFLIIFSLLFIITNNSFGQLKPMTIDPKTTVQKFNTLLNIINLRYVEPVDVDKLTEDAIVSMLKELDPHSVYIPKKEVQKVNEPLQGNFEGVGIQFQIYQDTLMVITAIPGGPSDELGIRSGDKIIKIDGELSVGSQVTNQFVFDKLRGPKGSKVVVSILRSGSKDLIDYTIKRDKIPINSIDAAYKIGDDIAYIKLSRFARTSLTEFSEALKKLQSQGTDKLIFDLRGNTGGYLDIAYELGNQFLSSGKLIVYTQGDRSPRQDFKSNSGGIFENGKLIVLIDEGSASAAEIVSGAVQDWDRGIIMGRRSFGKGLVQQPFLLPDSSMVRITVSRYYTPSGRCIQKPFKPGSDDYRDEISQRFKHGEMINADSISFPDSLKYYTNNNRPVYGGGGIMPDFFVPLDTSFTSKYLSDLFRKGSLNDFTIFYVDKYRKKLSKEYPNADTFIKNFQVTDELFNDFVLYAQEKGVARDEKGIETSGEYIKTIIKALIARNIFDINTYFIIIGNSDPVLQNAIKTMETPDAFWFLEK